MFTSASLIESLRQLRLLDAAQLDAARQLVTGFPEPRLLAAELSRRGWLTAFQVRMLVQGRGSQLVLGPHVILEKLGEGGMGAVYKARNTRLGRVVAIKLLRRERGTNADVVRRFRREVEVAASLSHPNVVRALDAAEVDGTLVFEMEYIEGVNLTQLVTKRGPLPVPMACDFIRQTALGLQHAHEKGLVHRDIKPSNIVVTRSSAPSGAAEVSPNGVVKLLDMGLALILPDAGGREKTRLTQLGKVVGTTDFLAPEQARNSHGVDIRADLYALGCTFYFLLTGRVPFPDGAPMEKLLRHQLDEPEAVERLRPEMPPALIPVVRKLMAKKAENRYQTPAEVAAVLEPFARASAKSTAVPPALPTAEAVPPLPPALPPVAVPPLPPPAPAPLKAPSAPMLPVALVGGAAVAVLEPPALPTIAATQTAPDSDPFLDVRLAPPARPPAGKRSLWLPLVVLLALGGLGVGGFFVWRRDPSPEPDKRPGPGGEKIPPPKGAETWSLDRLPLMRVAGQPKELVVRLGDPRQRHWGAVACVAYSQDGRSVAGAGHDGFIRVWDADTGKEDAYLVGQPGRVFALAFQSDKTLLSVHQAGSVLQVRAWNTGAAGNPGKIVLEKKDRFGTAAAVSPEGDTVAVAARKQDGTSEIFVADLESEDQASWATPEKTSVTHLAWSPDGKILAGATDKTIRLWDSAGKEVGPPAGHDQPVTGLAFAHLGRLLVSSSAVVAKDVPPSGEIRVWEVPGKKLKNTFPVPGPVLSLTLDAPGELIAWGFTRGSEHRVTVWDAANNREKGDPLALDTPPRVLAFAPDGRELASAGDDQAIRFWDLGARKERLLPLPPFRRITSPVLSPDGQSVAFLTWTTEQHVVVWDLVADKEKVLPRQKGKLGQSVAFVAGGKMLACWGPGVALFWNLSTGEEVKPFLPPPGTLLVGPVAPDARHVVLAGKDLPVRLWDPIENKEGVALKDAPKGFLGGAAFSPDGKLVALAVQPQAVVRLFDTATGAEKYALAGLTVPAGALAFSADGRLLAAVGRDGAVRVWDCATGKETCKAAARGGASILAFTANGAFLVLWGPRLLTVVDVAAQKERVLMSGADANLSAVAVGPAGQSLAFATTEGWLYLRDASAPREEPGTKIELPGPAHALTLSADGRHLITANGNGTLYVLRAAVP